MSLCCALTTRQCRICIRWTKLLQHLRGKGCSLAEKGSRGCNAQELHYPLPSTTLWGGGGGKTRQEKMIMGEHVMGILNNWYLSHVLVYSFKHTCGEQSFTCYKLQATDKSPFMSLQSIALLLKKKKHKRKAIHNQQHFSRAGWHRKVSKADM